MEWPNGTREWWLNGLRHREDGPAVKRAGYHEWWFHGLLNRETGPAIESEDGNRQWWHDGKRMP